MELVPFQGADIVTSLCHVTQLLQSLVCDVMKTLGQDLGDLMQ